MTDLEILKTLQDKFGHKQLRLNQSSVINNILLGRDTMVIMPTGGGKSLCYQLPAIMNSNKITIVISPLIALMHDQVDSLTKKNISARLINSSLSQSTGWAQ